MAVCTEKEVRENKKVRWVEQTPRKVYLLHLKTLSKTIVALKTIHVYQTSKTTQQDLQTLVHVF
jgi:hypothetical protein